MKTRIFDIESRALTFRCLINAIYLSLECLFALLLVGICKFLSFNLNLFTIILLLFISICIGEYVHRKEPLNSSFINGVYLNLFRIHSGYKRNSYLIFNSLYTIINILFFFFAFNAMYKFFATGQIYSATNNRIYEAIPVIITISSFVLSAIFATIQQFVNKYPDFLYLIKNWKKETTWIFIVLAFYTVGGFIILYNKPNSQTDFIVLVSSIYLVLMLILTGLKASLLMNIESILDIHKNYLINDIRTFPEIKDITKDKDYIKNIKREGFKNFIKYRVLGINVKSFFRVPEEVITNIKDRTEPLTRLANQYLSENNLNTFKSIIEMLKEISYQYIIKFGKDKQEKEFYIFISKKIEELYLESIRLQRTSFLEYLVQLNEYIALQIISNTEKQKIFYSNYIDIYNFRENAQKFVIISASYGSSKACPFAIDSQRRMIMHSIFKGATLTAKTVIEDVRNCTKVIDGHTSTHNIPLDFGVFAIRRCLFVLLNSLYYLIRYSVMNPEETSNIKYVLEEAIKYYNECFAILSKYNSTISDESTFLNCCPDSSLQMITEIVDSAPHINTPVYNMKMNGEKIDYPETISSLSQIFNVIFILDLHKSINFNVGIANLEYLLDIVTTSSRALITNKQITSFPQSLECLRSIFESATIFTKHFKTAKYDYENLIAKMDLFIEKLFSEILQVLELFLRQDEDIYNFFEKFAILMYKILNLLDILDEEGYSEKLSNYFDKIFDLFNSLSDENEYKKDYYSAIKLICVFIYSEKPESSLFKKIFKFIVDNYEYNEFSRGSLPDFYSYRSFPYYSKYFNLDNNVFINFHELAEKTWEEGC